MHQTSITPWAHRHDFLGADHHRNERRALWVVWLTAVMMAVEIAAGALFGSMALLADGFHMATHAGALTISLLAYAFARRHTNDARFTFGTGKIGDLAGFTSAVILAVISVLIGLESAKRLVAPVSIHFDDAIAVACLGLVVNLVSAWLLQGEHDHPGHSHDHDAHHNEEHAHHAHGHHDHNLRSAYLHVIADALTSLLAIVALLAGRFYGWVWMDPLMGVVGSLVIARWSWSLMRDTAKVLVDVVPDSRVATAVRERLEINGDRVSDLHLWRVGPGHAAAVVTLISDHPEAPNIYKERLVDVHGLSHITVEVQPCLGAATKHG